MSEPVPESVLDIGGLQIQPGDRIGPYIYRRLIGKGGMAHVVLATDPSGQSVALKVLKSSRMGTGLMRFKREFKALAKLRHPNVIRVDAYGDIYGHPYIAMEYVEGTDLHHVIHGFKELPSEERFSRSEEVLVDLCRALVYIHRRGLIHRDLKPSNVLINPEGVCKLTDFGIVKDLDPNTDAMVSTTLVGTWAYASPEQINGYPIDHRSDLYSLGVILFAMLTGKRPFVAKDLGGYLELHKHQSAPAPADMDPRVPTHLNDICRKLLQKMPKDRYRSAQEILYRLEQRTGVLPDSGWTPPLVGRAMQEELLRDRVAALTRGQGSVLFLEGPEGIGRTRLLDVLADHGRLLGVPVLQERVLPREEGGLGPIAWLCAAAGREAPVGASREKLVELLLQEMLHLREDGPLLLLLDDVQHASATLLEGMHQILRRLPVGILVAFTLRSDRVTPRIAALREGRERLLLPALSPTDVEDLVAGLLGAGRSATAVAERLYRETSGNPLFLTLYLQSLIHQGLLQRIPISPRASMSGAGWRLVSDLEEIASGYLELPPGVRDVVKARLDPLPPLHREVSEVLAVHGERLELDTLLEAMDQEEEPVSEVIDSLRDQGLVAVHSVGEQVWLELRHPRYTDVLYRELTEEHRAELHRLLAESLEARFAHAPGAAERVGEHYRRAGEAGKAWQYLCTAALRALERGLTAEAADLANRAALVEDPARVDLGTDAYTATRIQFSELRAELHQLKGEWSEAKEILESALILLDRQGDEALRLRPMLKLARVLRRLGLLDRAEELGSQALALARERHEREAVVDGLLTLSSLAWSRGDLDRCEALTQEGLVLASGPASGRARAALLLSLTSVQANRGQLASAAAGLTDAVAVLKDLRDKGLRAVALVNLAEVLLGQGEVSAAWERSEEALGLAREMGHRLVEAAVHRVRGMLLAQVGLQVQAEKELAVAVGMGQVLAVPQELCSAAFHLSRALLEQGKLEDAARHLDTASTALASGDPERYRIAVDVERALVHALAGRYAEGRALLEAAIPQAPLLPALRRSEVTLDIARCWAALGEVGLALSTVRTALQLASVRGFRLLVLEALAFGAWFSSDPAEKDRMSQQLGESLLALTLPPVWSASLRQRLGLA